VQNEVGIGGQHDPVQLEGEPVRVLAGGKLVLLERGDCESTDPALRWEVRGRRHAAFTADFDYRSGT